MNGMVTIAAEDAARQRGEFEVTLASLPVSFAAAGRDSDADVVVVDGRDGWADRLEAAASQARAVVLVEPRAPEVVNISIPVIVDRPYAGSPALEPVRRFLLSSDPSAPLEVRVTSTVATELTFGVIAALGLARAATGSEVADAHPVGRTRHGFVVRGRLADDRPVLIAVARTNAVPPASSLRVITADSMMRAHIPASGAARPALVRVADGHGDTLTPTVYETSHRFAWRRALAVVRGEATGDSLGELTDDLRMAAFLTGSASSHN